MSYLQSKIRYTLEIHGPVDALQKAIEAGEVLLTRDAQGRGILHLDPPALFADLRQKTTQELKDLGLRPWDEENRESPLLMLFPETWYAAIPEGYAVETVWGDFLEFKPGEFSRDSRGGCLAYGIRGTS